MNCGENKDVTFGQGKEMLERDDLSACETRIFVYIAAAVQWKIFMVDTCRSPSLGWFKCSIRMCSNSWYGHRTA